MGGVVCAREESEKSQLRRKLKKKVLFLVGKTFLFSLCREDFHHGEGCERVDGINGTARKKPSFEAFFSWRMQKGFDFGLQSGLMRSGNIVVHTKWKACFVNEAFIPQFYQSGAKGGTLADSRKTRNAC